MRHWLRAAGLAQQKSRRRLAICERKTKREKITKRDDFGSGSRQRTARACFQAGCPALFRRRCWSTSVVREDGVGWEKQEYPRIGLADPKGKTAHVFVHYRHHQHQHQQHQHHDATTTTATRTRTTITTTTTCLATAHVRRPPTVHVIRPPPAKVAAAKLDRWRAGRRTDGGNDKKRRET